jgi:hypothetical protein
MIIKIIVINGQDFTSPKKKKEWDRSPSEDYLARRINNNAICQIEKTFLDMIIQTSQTKILSAAYPQQAHCQSANAKNPAFTLSKSLFTSCYASKAGISTLGLKDSSGRI